jgi:hypothetical protein
MSDLKKIIADMADLEAEASVSLNAVHVSVRAGAEGRIRQAKTQLEKLRVQYLNDIMPHTILIAVTGPAAEKFATIAAEKYNTIAIDYKFLFNKLVAKLQARKARPKYDQFTHRFVMDELNSIKNTYGIAKMATPTYNGMARYSNKPLAEAVDILLKDTYGSSLDSAVIRREIGKAALKLRFNGSMLPVVLYNFDSDLDTGVDTNVLPRPVALLRAAKNLSEEQVKKNLLKIRDSLAPKPVTKNDEEIDQNTDVVTDTNNEVINHE